MPMAFCSARMASYHVLCSSSLSKMKPSESSRVNMMTACFAFVDAHLLMLRNEHATTSKTLL